MPIPKLRAHALSLHFNSTCVCATGGRATAEQPPNRGGGGGGNSRFQPPGRRQPQPPPLQGSNDEDDGVVAYPAAGSAADAAEDEEDGVVAYPQAGGPADRFDGETLMVASVFGLATRAGGQAGTAWPAVRLLLDPALVLRCVSQPRSCVPHLICMRHSAITM
jgi:hypothetical protein